LERQYRELLITTKSLQKARLEPSAGVVANIMNYVRGLTVKS
jgi:hypothetical protein